MPITTQKFIGQYTNFAENSIWKTFKKVILYGSYARGDYRDGSDIRYYDSSGFI